MRWIWLGATVLVAAASGFWAFATLIETMMAPRDDVYSWVLGALLAIGVSLVGGVLLTVSYDPVRSRSRYVFLIVVMILAGVAPGLMLTYARWSEHHEQLAKDRAFEATVLAGIERRKRDVETRIAERRPYPGKDALDFVNFVAGTDLRYRSLGDHTAAALALLKRALEGKVLDPNVMVRGPTRADVADEPLFIQFSKSHIRSTTHGTKPPERVDRVDWEIQTLLVQHGADLTRPEAAGVAEDVRRTAMTDDLDPRKMRLR
jgi:hypothetical protein